jgi:transcriptional regulator with XRE-family HTH domain
MGPVTDSTPIRWPGASCRRSSPPGAITGAVLRAARRSAGLTTARLAQIAGFREAALRLWEHGAPPLGDEPTVCLAQLRAALRGADADPQIIGDLETAVWCDLIVTGLIHARCTHLDEPLDPAVLELLAWAMAGALPDRYLPHARSGSLLPSSDVRVIANAASRLACETCPGVRQYGAAVASVLAIRVPSPISADGALVEEPLRGDRAVNAVAAGRMPHGTLVIVSGGDHATVRVRRLEDGTPLLPPLELPESVNGVAVHGNVIVTAAGIDIAVLPTNASSAHALSSIPKVLFVTGWQPGAGPGRGGVGRSTLKWIWPVFRDGNEPATLPAGLVCGAAGK